MNIDTATEKIREYYRQYKRLPSYQEMCDLLGYASKRSVHQIVHKLIEAGILQKDAHGRLMPKKLTLSLPVLGAIQAGYPTTADQVYFGNVQLEEFIVRNPLKSYMLQVQGDSMIDAGIQPGDYVVIEQCEKPKNGDIVAAQIDGDVTLKYFKSVPNGISLVPGNSKYPEFSPKESLRIFGKVVSVIRKYV
jgi:SOS regulatory protein LexA